MASLLAAIRSRALAPPPPLSGPSGSAPPTAPSVYVAAEARRRAETGDVGITMTTAAAPPDAAVAAMAPPPPPPPSHTPALSRGGRASHGPAGAAVTLQTAPRGRALALHTSIDGSGRVDDVVPHETTLYASTRPSPAATAVYASMWAAGRRHRHSPTRTHDDDDDDLETEVLSHEGDSDSAAGNGVGEAVLESPLTPPGPVGWADESPSFAMPGASGRARVSRGSDRGGSAASASALSAAAVVVSVPPHAGPRTHPRGAPTQRAMPRGAPRAVPAFARTARPIATTGTSTGPRGVPLPRQPRGAPLPRALPRGHPAHVHAQSQRGGYGARLAPPVPRGAPPMARPMADSAAAAPPSAPPEAPVPRTVPHDPRAPAAQPIAPEAAHGALASRVSALPVHTRERFARALRVTGYGPARHAMIMSGVDADVATAFLHSLMQAADTATGAGSSPTAGAAAAAVAGAEAVPPPSAPPASSPSLPRDTEFTRQFYRSLQSSFAEQPFVARVGLSPADARRWIRALRATRSVEATFRAMVLGGRCSESQMTAFLEGVVQCVEEATGVACRAGGASGGTVRHDGGGDGGVGAGAGAAGDAMASPRPAAMIPLSSAPASSSSSLPSAPPPPAAPPSVADAPSLLRRLSDKVMAAAGASHRRRHSGDSDDSATLAGTRSLSQSFAADYWQHGPVTRQVSDIVECATEAGLTKALVTLADAVRCTARAGAGTSWWHSEGEVQARTLLRCDLIRAAQARRSAVPSAWTPKVARAFGTCLRSLPA